MKDFIGQDVNAGDYFAYPLTCGRSAVMAIYKFHSETDSGNVRGIKVEHSYNRDESWRYKVYVGGEQVWREMTTEEREKVDNKTTTLKHFSDRAVLLKGYNEQPTV